jgi:mRNA interferase RelE/StbE
LLLGVRRCALGVAGRGFHHPRPRPLLTTMFQVTFSEQAMGELNRLDKLVQLLAIEPISMLKATDMEKPREPLSRFHLETRGDETLHVIYILHEGSLEDFLVRNKLPVSEQQLVEQHSKFWKYLETLTK